MPVSGDIHFHTEPSDADTRLDILLTARIPDRSRAFLGRLIRDGRITVNGVVKKPGYRIQPGDEIAGRIPAPKPPSLTPQPIDIDILYEDAQVVVVNKAPGLVVHPAPGHSQGTLVNALLYHCRGFEGIGETLRPGIVHRLDKDTSGVMVVAKNDQAHWHLSRQFKSRQIEKIYLAVVCGVVAQRTGTIRLPIGRHPVKRKQMSVHSKKSRAAETRWEVKEAFGAASLLALSLKTGRTHQIRVHCAAMGHPILGDPVYGGRKSVKTVQNRPPITAPRQMLHARRLGFMHPQKETFMRFEAPLAEDMRQVLERLREIRPAGCPV